MEEEVIAFIVEEETYNFDTYDANNIEGIDECLILYDWLADTATTSHITHHQEAFKTYTPMGNSSVMGVGSKEAKIDGCRTVELVSTCSGQDFILLLGDVIHVPRTQNNLILLGRWDATGGRYTRGKRVITLITKDGQQVAEGPGQRYLSQEQSLHDESISLETHFNFN